MILKAADRAANLTRQLLLFSRRQPMQTRSVDLGEVVTQFAKLLKRILGEVVQVHLKFAPQQLFVRADAGMLEQVLMNLAVNARDAMPKGGNLIIETSQVHFDSLTAAQSPQARAGDFACLAVSDTGTGIAPEVRARIFEPFFTTKEPGKGTGLGLATVFGIVQQHEGWVDFYSEVGQGTIFRVYLPRLSSHEGEVLERSAFLPPRGRNETILLVEDEAALRVLEHAILTQLGYRVLEASDGAGALKIWLEHAAEVKLLFTDLVLPGELNGKELAAELLRQNPALQVMYASGYSVEVAGRDLRLEEGVNFLSKPFDLRQVAQSIRKRLDGV
jgi:two-component system, cell cycle sensor histidine kinase and response regulator CckA